MFEEDTIKFLIADLQSIFLSRIQGLPLCVNCDERETKLQLRRQATERISSALSIFYCEQ